MELMCECGHYQSSHNAYILSCIHCSCKSFKSKRVKMSKAKQFTKIPVSIEAIQFKGLDEYLDIVDWYKEVNTSTLSGEEIFAFWFPILLINIDGRWDALNPGDWIVRNTEGKFVRVQEDVFAQEYALTQPAFSEGEGLFQ